MRSIFAALFLAALFIGSVLAQSQPPSPTLVQGESHPPQSHAKNSAHKPQTDQRGTDNAPFVVQIAPSPDSDKKAADESKYQEKKATTDRWLIWVTAILAVAALLQWGALLNQVRLLRKSIKTQTTDMGRHITESARAADAMERVSASMATQVATTTTMLENQREFWKRQMRAYLSVYVQEYVPQDRNTGWKYEIRMGIINTGHTPAHAVIAASRAKIMLFPLPVEYDLALPFEEQKDAGHIAPGQKFTFRANLDELVTDEELMEFTSGTNLKLYIYGTVIYRDEFDDLHHTNFCQWCLWDMKGLLTTINVPRHNDAN